jgi:hypothetical protein
MKKLMAGLMAASLTVALSVTSIVPAGAQEAFWRNRGGNPEHGLGIDNLSRYNGGGYRREFRGRDFGGARDWRADRGWRGDGGYRTWRGHRGYRSYRRGYREYNGWWFPSAAFVTGAIIGGAIANEPTPRRAYRSGESAHTEWCYNRYRSYRAYDNTYQPNYGPRKRCYSPYS